MRSILGPQFSADPQFSSVIPHLTGFFQLKYTNLGKYINPIGSILRVLNIEHISHAMPYAVVFDDILICPYVEKGCFLVIVVMAVELSTFIGYT